MPKQHGAWAMLLAPVVVGAVQSGVRPLHGLLVAAWLVAYLAFQATALWLTARRRPRYRRPVQAYGAAAVLLAAPLLALRPDVLLWAPVVLPAAVVSLTFSARRRERAMANDVLTVAVACLVGLVAYGLGGAGPAGRPPGSASAQAWTSAAVLAAYFVGTALYVKTMIRERGSVAWLRASVLYHVALPPAVVAAAVVSSSVPDAGPATPVGALPGLTAGGTALLVVLLAGLAVRAALVPHRWPRATPRALGIGELAATTALVAVLVTG